MSIRVEIHDLSFFTLKSTAHCVRGEAYILGDTLRFRSMVNAHQVVVNLSGHGAPSIEDFTNSHSTVAALLPGMKTRVKPLAPLMRCTSDINLRGQLVPLAGGFGLCANFIDDMAHHAPGRIVVNLKNGDAYFHEREFPFAFAQWQIAWIDGHGNDVLTLHNSATAPVDR